MGSRLLPSPAWGPPGWWTRHADERGSTTSTPAPIVDLDVAHRQAALGVGEVHDDVPARRDHAELAQHVEFLAQPADARDVHAREHHDVGRPVERREGLRRQAGRGVDDDVTELPRQGGQQSRDVVGGDRVPGRRGLRAAHRVQPARVLGEEGLEDHRVLAGGAVDRVGQRVLGHQAERRGARHRTGRRGRRARSTAAHRRSARWPGWWRPSSCPPRPSARRW